MNARARALFAALALTVTLAACGGGGGTAVTTTPGGGTSPNGPGTLSVSPSSLTFSGPGAAAQSFTVTSTVPNLPAPSLNGGTSPNSGSCGSVATIATTSTTLPATYTVTPTANGTCSFTFDLGHASVALGVVVGPSGGNTITPSAAQTVNLYLGGTNGSVTVSSSSGTSSFDATACASIAAVSAGASAGTYTIAPLAIGSCQFVITSGSASVTVNVTVNATPSGAAALSVAPTSMTFSNSTASTPQQGTLNFSGAVGQVSIDESDCTGGANGTAKPKLAYLTLNGVTPGAPVSLPAAFTVTLYGNGNTGTCNIVFTPQNGSSATLAVTVNP